MQHSEFRTKSTHSKVVRNGTKVRAMRSAAYSLAVASIFMFTCSISTYAAETNKVTLDTDSSNSLNNGSTDADGSQSGKNITLSQMIAKETVKVSEEKIQELTEESKATTEKAIYPDDKEGWIFQFLTKSEESGGAGLTKAGASAVMGCIKAESSFNVMAENPNDGGYGLLQWTNTTGSDRRTALESWCHNNGYDVNSLDGQMKFFLDELKSKYSASAGYNFGVYETLKNSTSVEECLKMFFCHAEAGHDVKISDSVSYAGTSTKALFDARYASAWNYYSTY